MNVEYQNHKGKFCWIRDNIFCQENRCSGCQIYHDEKLCPKCEANLSVWLEMFGEKCCKEVTNV